jgi:hypothetical protein
LKGNLKIIGIRQGSETYLNMVARKVGSVDIDDDDDGGDGSSGADDGNDDDDDDDDDGDDDDEKFPTHTY